MMKIGKLDQHCGDCKIIELCGEPFSEVMLCANTNLDNIEEDRYIEIADDIYKSLEQVGVRLDNKMIETLICYHLKNGGN